jgi:hypothetical protein
LNVHGGSGRDAQVWMVLDPDKFEPIQGHETGECSDADCIQRPLSSELRVRSIR